MQFITNKYLTLVMADNLKDALEVCCFKQENEEIKFSYVGRITNVFK